MSSLIKDKIKIATVFTLLCLTSWIISFRLLHLRLSTNWLILFRNPISVGFHRLYTSQSIFIRNIRLNRRLRRILGAIWPLPVPPFARLPSHFTTYSEKKKKNCVLVQTKKKIIIEPTYEVSMSTKETQAKGENTVSDTICLYTRICAYSFFNMKTYLKESAYHNHNSIQEIWDALYLPNSNQ